jgi:hypothetical protein
LCASSRNRAAAICLLGAVLLEQHERCSTGRTYLDLDLCHQWCVARDAAKNEGQSNSV